MTKHMNHAQLDSLREAIFISMKHSFRVFGLPLKDAIVNDRARNITAWMEHYTPREDGPLYENLVQSINVAKNYTDTLGVGDHTDTIKLVAACVQVAIYTWNESNNGQGRPLNLGV